MRPHPALPCLLLTLLLAPSSGLAADFYLSGNLVMSGATGEASGSTDFFDISGEDQDSSPGYGGALGFGVALDEMLPPVWGIEHAELAFRWEVEGVLGRDFELRTEGGDGFFSEASSWSVMTNLWLDVPVHPPLAWAFGRLPILQPLSLYGGAGVGTANLDVETTDNISQGSDSSTHFAWQAGAGISYEFTEWATLTAGWRYVDLGEVETPLAFISGGDPLGNHAFEFEAHEFVSTLRFDFYSRPLKELSPHRWKMPRMPRWRWLPWRRGD